MRQIVELHDTVRRATSVSDLSPALSQHFRTESAPIRAIITHRLAPKLARIHADPAALTRELERLEPAALGRYLDEALNLIRTPGPGAAVQAAGLWLLLYRVSDLAAAEDIFRRMSRALAWWRSKHREQIAQRLSEVDGQAAEEFRGQWHLSRHGLAPRAVAAAFDRLSSWRGESGKS
jgi:hypothetical protein